MNKPIQTCEIQKLKSELSTHLSPTITKFRISLVHLQLSIPRLIRKMYWILILAVLGKGGWQPSKLIDKSDELGRLGRQCWHNAIRST